MQKSLLLLTSFIHSQCSNYGSKCPSWAPCCKNGWCSDDPNFCKTGCDNKNSYNEESCYPRYYCKDIEEHFESPNIKNENDYSGNPEDSELISKFKPDHHKIENGNLLLQVKYDDRPNEQGRTQGFGTTIQTSRYMEFGKITARMKTASKFSGIVSSLITKSPDGDEIDFEWVGKSPKEVQTNYYFGEIVDYEKVLKVQKEFDTSTDFHTYEIDWQPEFIKWSVDGKVVRELKKSDTFNKSTNQYLFPDKPSQVGVGVWDGGRGPDGTVDWAGPSNWDDKHRVHTAYVDWIKIECYYKGNDTIKFKDRKKKGKVNVHYDVNDKGGSNNAELYKISIFVAAIFSAVLFNNY